MTKLLCFRNLGLLFLSGIILTSISISMSPAPDYMKSEFAFILGGFIFCIGPAFLVLLIGLIVQRLRFSGQDTGRPQGISTYSSQNGGRKEKIETWDEKLQAKMDTEVKPGWKTIFIIAWIVFATFNIVPLIGNLMLMYSNE